LIWHLAEKARFWRAFSCLRFSAAAGLLGCGNTFAKRQAVHSTARTARSPAIGRIGQAFSRKRLVATNAQCANG